MTPLQARHAMGSNPVKQEQPVASDCHTCRVDQVFDLVDLHDSDPARYPHLLQSTAHGRYDILFACPEESLVLNAHGLEGPGSEQADFLAGFDAWWSSLQTPVPAATSLPFRGGWFVYLGYDAPARRPVAGCRCDTFPVRHPPRPRAGDHHDHCRTRVR
jgi:hypothetical protein